jgi:small subunit ribosomal protein S2
MKGMPAPYLWLDPKKERIAVKEARTWVIPVIGIADTNCGSDD